MTGGLDPKVLASNLMAQASAFSNLASLNNLQSTLGVMSKNISAAVG